MLKKSILSLWIVFFLLMTPQAWSQGTTRWGESYCQTPGFRCVQIQAGESWDKLWPDETQRKFIQEINRMNVRLREGMTLAVPENLDDSKFLDLSPLPQTIEAPHEKQITVDLKNLAWGAYDEEGRILNWGAISGGKSFCKDTGHACRTPKGEFRIFQLGGAGCKSSKFPIPKGGAPMPYCMYFKPGYALHGSYEVQGYNASHGCVRMFPADAKWLNQKFIGSLSTDIGFTGARVVILSEKATDI